MNLNLLFLRVDKLIQIFSSWNLLSAFFISKVLAGAEHRSILSVEYNTIVDVGANKGQFALASREWAPNSRIISFEPLPQPGAIFQKIFLKANPPFLLLKKLKNQH